MGAIQSLYDIYQSFKSTTPKIDNEIKRMLRSGELDYKTYAEYVDIINGRYVYEFTHKDKKYQFDGGVPRWGLALGQYVRLSTFFCRGYEKEPKMSLKDYVLPND